MPTISDKGNIDEANKNLEEEQVAILEKLRKNRLEDNSKVDLNYNLIIDLNE